MKKSNKDTDQKQKISQSVLAFLRLQRSILFKSKILLFIVLVPLFIFLMLLSIVPINLATFTLISLNLNIIGYFQFGSFYINFENTTIEKNILMRNSSKILKDINFIIFSLVLSFITTFMLLGFTFAFESIISNFGIVYGHTSSSNLINWNHLWWNNLIVYIFLASLLASTTSYFVVHLTNYNVNYFYSIGVIFLFVIMFFGGTFVSLYQIVENDSGTYKWISNSRSDVTNIFQFIKQFFPVYQLNQVAIYTFRVPNANVDALNPLFNDLFKWKYVYSSLWIVGLFMFGMALQLSNKY